MSNYQKGRGAENYIKKRLIATGFKVFRLAGSKPADLIAVSETDMLLIEVKSYRLSENKQQEEARKLAEICEGTPMKPCIIHKPSGTRYKMIEFREEVKLS